MSALKFLAVDGSLDSGREMIGRFKMKEECLLPRFEEGPSELPPGATAAGSLSRWRRLLAWLWGGPHQTRQHEEGLFTGGLGGEAPGPDGVATPAPSEGGGTARLPVRVREKRPVSAGPAQCEFRFENVTVVCNDLNDADLEVVTPRAKEGSGPFAVGRGLPVNV